MAESSKPMASGSASPEKPAARKSQNSSKENSRKAAKAKRQANDEQPVSDAWANVKSGTDQDRESALRKFAGVWSAYVNRLSMHTSEERGNAQPELVRIAVVSDLVTILLNNIRSAQDDSEFDAIGQEITEAFRRLKKLEAKCAPQLQEQLHDSSSRVERSEAAGSPRDLTLTILHIGGRYQNGKQTKEYDEMDDYRMRDSRGRFTDDDGDHGRNRSSRRSDDDNRRGRSRSDDDRGWYGDSRGHAEAAYRGWETRRGESHDDDNDRYGRSSSSRSSRDDDYGNGRRSDRSDDYESGGRGRGHGGWFGDSEGHSRAARGQSGGRSSGRYEDDDDMRRSRSRDEDYDDDRRGRGHGGWFGDSEGHSEASHRGWENRRDYDDRGGRRR